MGNSCNQKIILDQFAERISSKLNLKVRTFLSLCDHSDRQKKTSVLIRVLLLRKHFIFLTVYYIHILKNKTFIFRYHCTLKMKNGSIAMKRALKCFCFHFFWSNQLTHYFNRFITDVCYFPVHKNICENLYTTFKLLKKLHLDSCSLYCEFIFIPCHPVLWIFNCKLQ